MYWGYSLFARSGKTALHFETMQWFKFLIQDLECPKPVLHCLFYDWLLRPWTSPKQGGGGRQTDKVTDITTYKRNRPKG